MQVYISVDMEGIAGVVHVDQTRRTGYDYERARRWMTLEANAAVLGAFDAGARAVLVNDAHGDMRNLLLEERRPSWSRAPAGSPGRRPATTRRTVKRC